MKRLQNKPFALLGVNSDKTRAILRETQEKESLTWRSWWAGPGGGQIAAEWSVFEWPTLVLIDHKGVIRARGIAFSQVEKAINQLLREMEAEGKATTS